MANVKYKLVLFLAALIGASLIKLFDSRCYDAIIPENLPVIQKECPELFKSLMFCVADHGECLTGPEKVADCSYKFLLCAEKSRSDKLTTACLEFLANSIDHIRRNGGKCVREQVDEVVEEIKYKLLPIASILLNDTTVRALSTRDVNGNFGSITDVVDLFVPFFNKISLDYGQNAEDLETALLEMEQKNSKCLGIPFPLWYGGLGHGMIAKVFDRVLVSSLCGHNDAQKINHAWARCADCLASGKTINCTYQLIDTLVEASVESVKGRTVCNMYVEAMQSYTQLIIKSTYDDKIFQYVDSEFVINQETSLGMLRSSHLFLLKLDSSELLSYKECYSVKRTLSSCEFSGKYCAKNIGTDCAEKLSQCHIGMVDADGECRKKLVQSRSIMEVIGEWFSFIVHNPLVILVIVVTFIAAVCGYISDFMRAKENLNKFSKWARKVARKTETPEGQPGDGIPVITTDTELMLNNNENNNGNNENGTEQAKETEDEAKKEESRFWSWAYWTARWTRFKTWIH